MYLDPEIEQDLYKLRFQQLHDKLRKEAENLYRVLPSLCGDYESDDLCLVSLEHAVKRLKEVYGTDTAASQPSVWRSMQMLHDLGRIRLDPMLIPDQKGKSVRSVVLYATFTFLWPGFFPPPMEVRFDPIGRQLPIETALIKASECKKQRKRHLILRADAKAASKLGKAVVEIETKLTRS